MPIAFNTTLHCMRQLGERLRSATQNVFVKGFSDLLPELFAALASDFWFLCRPPIVTDIRG